MFSKNAVNALVALAFIAIVCGCGHRNCSYGFEMINDTQEPIRIEHYFLNSVSLDTEYYTLPPGALQRIMTFGGEDKKCEDMWANNGLLNVGIFHVYRADTVESQTNFSEREAWEFKKERRLQFRYTAHVKQTDF